MPGVDLFVEGVRGIETAEVSTRDRRDGDARHVVVFACFCVLLVLALAAADRWVERWMSPSPPLWLGHLENHEIIDLFGRVPGNPDEVSLSRKRALLDEAGSPHVLADDDDSIIDRFARAQQYAQDLEDARDNANGIIQLGGILLSGAAASRVDYRWRDGLLWLTVPVGIGIVFVVKFLWRMTSPTWYWTPEEDRVHRPMPFARIGIGFVAGIVGALVLLALAWVIHDLTS